MLYVPMIRLSHSFCEQLPKKEPHLICEPFVAGRRDVKAKEVRSLSSSLTQLLLELNLQRAQFFGTQASELIS